MEVWVGRFVWKDVDEEVGWRGLDGGVWIERFGWIWLDGGCGTRGVGAHLNILFGLDKE